MRLEYLSITHIKKKKTVHGQVMNYINVLHCYMYAVILSSFFQPIAPNEELKVWYAGHYAKQLDKKLLKPGYGEIENNSYPSYFHKSLFVTFSVLTLYIGPFNDYSLR